MLKISCTGCLGLFPVIPALFTLHMCVAAKNRKKITQTPYFWGSWSFKIIDVANLEKLLSSACYDKQQICIYLQPFSRWTN